MNSSIHAWRRGLATAAAVLLLGAGAGACGDEKSPANGSAAGGDKDTAENRDGVAYAACMRKNGVEVADPKPGEAPELPRGVPQSVLDKAEKKCGKGAGSSDMAGSLGELADDPEFERLSLEYNKCLRENGYELPEKKESGEGSVAVAPGDDPVFQRASKACKKRAEALENYMKKGKQ
ncbi:hypothetical protein [Streptomyces sp. NPDC057301]|uniref:hypothetical protein n=1 Tax=Streptomyces sp. NPDC057301 TaxID=3346093 RepID=UPI0036391FDD